MWKGSGSRSRGVRGAVLVVVAAALFVTPSAGAARQSPPPPFRTGNYAGTTSQQLPISFHVSRNRLSHITFRWLAVCTDSTGMTSMKSGQTSGLPPMGIAFVGQRFGNSFHGHIIFH